MNGAKSTDAACLQDKKSGPDALCLKAARRHRIYHRQFSLMSVAAAYLACSGFAFGQSALPSRLDRGGPLEQRARGEAQPETAELLRDVTSAAALTTEPAEDGGPDDIRLAQAVNDAPLPATDPSLTHVVRTDSDSAEFVVSTPASHDFNFVAKVKTGVTYDDNIFIRHTNRESDAIFTVAPTVAGGVGDVRPELKRLSLDTFTPAVVDEGYVPRDFLLVRYTPTALVFIDHSDENAVDHDAAFQGRLQFAYLTLGFRTSFQKLTTPDVDVGGRVSRSLFAQEFSAAYDYSDRTSFEFGLTGSARRYPSHVDSQEITSQNWINYRVGAWTDLGAGVTLGYLDVEDSPGQFYQQGLLRARYRATEKISLSANGGVEFREVEQRDRATPVFGLALSYTPFEQTLFSLEGSRRVENSAGTAGLNIEYSTLTLNIRQRLAQHYYIGTSASYQAARYVELTGNASNREDDLYDVQPYVRMDISKTAALQAGYVFRRDSSSVERFTFRQNQVYLHLNLFF